MLNLEVERLQKKCNFEPEMFVVSITTNTPKRVCENLGLNRSNAFLDWLKMLILR